MYIENYSLRNFWQIDTFYQNQFEDQKKETTIKNIQLNSPKKSHNTNNYKIDDFVEYYSNANLKSKFGIHISFQRTTDGINGVVINNHLICGMLVLSATINFVMNPKDTNRGVLLVTIFLVLATFFTAANVNELIQNKFYIK